MNMMMCESKEWFYIFMNEYVQATGRRISRWFRGRGMGITYSSYPCDDLDTQFESDLVSCKIRPSLSFNGLKSFDSGKLILSFRGREDLEEPKISLEANPMVRSVSFSPDESPPSPHNLSEKKTGGDFRHEAALRLQKTYKSFRTRRRLADCAVLAEQRWLVYQSHPYQMMWFCFFWQLTLFWCGVQVEAVRSR